MARAGFAVGTPAEQRALNVFHDLQLAYVRQAHGAPKQAACLDVSGETNVLEKEKAFSAL